MEIKVGFVRGYDKFWVQADNPMDKPQLQDFDGNDSDYLSELQIWERAEMNRKKFAVIDSQQKIAKKFVDMSIKYEVIRIDNLFKAKIIGKNK